MNTDMTFRDVLELLRETDAAVHATWDGERWDIRFNRSVGGETYGNRLVVGPADIDAIGLGLMVRKCLRAGIATSKAGH